MRPRLNSSPTQRTESFSLSLAPGLSSKVWWKTNVWLHSWMRKELLQAAAVQPLQGRDYRKKLLSARSAVVTLLFFFSYGINRFEMSPFINSLLLISG